MPNWRFAKFLGVFLSFSKKLKKGGRQKNRGWAKKIHINHGGMNNVYYWVCIKGTVDLYWVVVRVLVITKPILFLSILQPGKRKFGQKQRRVMMEEYKESIKSDKENLCFWCHFFSKRVLSFSKLELISFTCFCKEVTVIKSSSWTVGSYMVLPELSCVLRLICANAFLYLGPSLWVSTVYLFGLRLGINILSIFDQKKEC